MKDQSPIIFWFKKDLRLLDNPALYYAAKENSPIIFIYIHSPIEHGFWYENSLQSHYLHNSLEKLTNNLKKKKLKLHIFEGKADQILKSVIKKTKAKSLYFNYEYEPKIYKRDQKIIKDFEKQNIVIKAFHANLLHNPNDIKTKLGHPYQVFTQFYNSAKKYQTIENPLPIPTKLISKDFLIGSKLLDNLKLKKNKSFEKTIKNLWPAGEDEALKKLKSFLSKKINNYKKLRDFPGIDGTSLMSHHLHFGEISPKYIFHKAKNCSSSTIYIKEIYWREFSKYILFHFSKTETKPLKKEFEIFSWKKNKKLFKAWCDGKTGYPIIDAAMRQLNKTGWMHNRCRMLTASFLVKDLLQNWLNGAKYFWDHLIDADLANNTMGWQWSAGCGADAAPFFRIFNPVLQSKKFDPKGEYIKKYVPELKNLTAKEIHTPWLLNEDILKKANISLGKNYPYPIIDIEKARKKALLEFHKIRKKK